MRKNILFFMLVIFLMFTILIQATANTKLTSTASALVIDVVDGNAIIVRLMSGELAYIRLVGIDSRGNNESITFLTSYLLGKKVLIEPELSMPATLFNTRWNFAYVYLNHDDSLSTSGKELINETMLYKGYAVMDSDYYSVNNQRALSAAQSTSQARALGLWNELSDANYRGDKININTASLSRLTEHIIDLPYNVANNIVEYRENNPFNSIYDIKFVSGFTKELFDAYRDSFNVVTSLNHALEYELETLIDISSTDVSRIINHRKSNRFSRVLEVYSEAKISEDTYNKNLPFLSTSERSSINMSTPDLVVNINTATPSQISQIENVSYDDADKIVDFRRNNLYGYKNIFELTKISGFKMKDKYLHFVCDNFSLITNINSAKDSELRSLLGADSSADLVDRIKQRRPFTEKSDLKSIIGERRYNEIEAFIYINSIPNIDRININTATRQQLKSINLSEGAINSIINRQGFIFTAKDIPVDTSMVREKISLYTDINTASDTELLSLHSNMSSFISDVNRYRSDQPFGSIEEVGNFFTSQNQYSLFKLIEPFIVIR